jgi:hypothetical protein
LVLYIRRAVVTRRQDGQSSRRIVTWAGSPRPVDLREKGIDESQAADLRCPVRARLWDCPPAAGCLLLPRIGIVPKWPFTMNCRRGDVVLVLFPDSNLRTSKRRPALVIQADRLGLGLPQTIVAMIHQQHSACRLHQQSAGTGCRR